MLELFIIDLREIDPDDEGIHAVLSKGRTDKIAQLKMPHSKLESIGAELALIKAVQHFYPDAPLPLNYHRNEHGKPYLCDYPKLHINISHSGNYAVCVASDTPVGVDIQEIRKANFRIAQRYFTQAECEHIGNNKLRFFDLWAKKESYVKATGTGITVPLNSFSVLDNGDNYEFLSPAFHDKGYVLRICRFYE